MKIKRYIILVVVLSLTILQSKPALTEAKSEKDINALLRSAVLPGWGQYYLGQKKKGKILMISEVALLTGAIITYQMKNSAYNKYNKTQNQNEIDKYYDEANNYHYISNYFTIGAIAVWVYSIIDIKLYEEKINEVGYFDKKAGISFSIINKQLNFCYNKMF